VTAVDGTGETHTNGAGIGPAARGRRGD